jgi:hypothetical protein
LADLSLFHLVANPDPPSGGRPPAGTNAVTAPPATARANTDRDCGHQPNGRRDRRHDHRPVASNTAVAARHRTAGSGSAAATAAMKANFLSIGVFLQKVESAPLCRLPNEADVNTNGNLAI